MQIVIFDMDGTLVDSGEDITASVNHVRKKVYNLAPLQVEYVVEAINLDKRNLALLFYETPLYEPEARQEFENHYHDQCIRTLRLYEGIDELLENLVHRSARISVATNAPARFAKRMLAHLGLETIFDRIIGSEDVSHPKPHPDMLLTLLDGYGYVPGQDQALMVGDNDKDMKAARQAGISGAFATWGFSESGAGDYSLSRPDEVLQLLSGDGAFISG
jgi:HAD superfamily hydrolase (TIGR01549 family)